MPAIGVPSPCSQDMGRHLLCVPKTCLYFMLPPSPLASRGIAAKERARQALQAKKEAEDSKNGRTKGDTASRHGKLAKNSVANENKIDASKKGMLHTSARAIHFISREANGCAYFHVYMDAHWI